MLITNLLNPKAVRLELSASSREGVIEELVDCVVVNGKTVRRQEVIKALLEREKLGSTAVGQGAAIPHAKVKGVERVVCGFGRCSKGIDFASEDNKPVHFFFLLLAPVTKAGDHLKALAKIARMMKDGSFRDRLMAAKNEGELYQVIREKDEEEL